MARTLNARWLAAFRQAQVRPVLIMKITLGERPDSPNDLYNVAFVSGDAPLFGYPCSIAGMTSVGIEADPITRTVSFNAVTVTMLDDGLLRALALTYALINRPVELLIGTPELAETDFVTLLGKLRIKEIVPSEGQLTIELDDTRAESLALKDEGFEWPDHPWSLLRELMRRGRQQSAQQAPAANFAIPASDTSHFVVTRRQYHPLPEGEIEAEGNNREEILRRLQALCEISYSLLSISEIGESKVIPWNPSRMGVGDFEWTANDIADVEQVSSFGNVITRVSADAALDFPALQNRVSGRPAPPKIEPRYTARDTEAETDLRGPFYGQDIALHEHAVESTWMTSGCKVGDLFNIPVGKNKPALLVGETSLRVALPFWHGFCGTRTEDVGSRPRGPGALVDEAIYGPLNTGTVYDVSLGVNVIGRDYMRDGLANFNQAAYEASYSGVGNTNTIEVVWFTGATELGRSTVTSASAGGDYLRFEAIEQSLVQSIGLASIVSNGNVTYQIIERTSSLIPLSSTISAASALSVSRPGYVLLIDRENPERQEIVKATAFSYDTSKGTLARNWQSSRRPGESETRDYWREGAFTIVRGQLGTTAQEFGPTTVAFDVTIAEWLARQILARAHYGMPELSLRVGLDKLSAEIGDIGTVTWPLLFGHRISGSGSASILWEITRLEIDVISESPGISISLTSAAIATHTPVDVVPVVGYAALSSPLLEPYFDAGLLSYIDGVAVTYITRY
jgi:hypothetical protein